MGERLNKLREISNRNAGIYMAIADDYIFITKNWDNNLRKAINSFPDRIVLAFPEDPIAEPNQITHMWVSTEWTNILGRYISEYFPFWYDDVWYDQVAQMIQRKVKLDIEVIPQGDKGKTQGMRNLLFWEQSLLSLSCHDVCNRSYQKTKTEISF